MLHRVEHFRANGKLLLTAEYTVLRGALALSLPTKQGQMLSISPSGDEKLHWQSCEADGSTWFSAIFSADFVVETTTDLATATALAQLLQNARTLNSQFNPFGTVAKADATFNRDWGLGSSSTLVALVAQWAGVDALLLFFNTQTGSGYDVASALHNNPIFYRLRGDGSTEVIEATFHPPFADDLSFVYLGKKQRSNAEVARFASKETIAEHVDHITALTNGIAASQKMAEFEFLLHEHEQLTGRIIGQSPIQSQLFKDYPGVVKSLGAWGGDFVLATRGLQNQDYFAQRGFTTILRWCDLFDF